RRPARSRIVHLCRYGTVERPVEHATASLDAAFAVDFVHYEPANGFVTCLTGAPGGVHKRSELRHAEPWIVPAVAVPVLGVDEPQCTSSEREVIGRQALGESAAF